MTGHPLYLRDADDEFDSTYATWYFRCPDQFEEALAPAAAPPVDMSARWREAIARTERGEFRPAEIAFMDRLRAQLTDPGASPVIEV